MTAKSRRAILAFGTALLLASCDPASVPQDPKHTELSIHVEPTGAARADLRLAPELEGVLDPTTERLAPSVFGTRSGTVGIDGNDGGFDFAVIHQRDAYEPGAIPRIAIAINDDAAQTLAAVGADTLDVNFCAPYVPYDIESSPEPESNDGRCGFWRLDLASDNLNATILMRPDTSRWYRSVLLTIIALVSVVAALVCLRRLRPLNFRRRASIVAAAVPGAAAFAFGVITLAAAPNGDNLGVAGDLDGAALTIATGSPVALLPLGVACVALGIVALAAERSRPTAAAPSARRTE